MPDDARQQLARAQAQLLGALVAGAAAPAGFDGERLAAAAESLVSKRARAVARAWPRLARAMSGEFAGRFASYARAHPLTGDGSPLADGRAFAAWLEREGRLSDEGRLEAFAFDARCRISEDKIVYRRGPSLRALRLKETRRLVVFARLPLLGERWLHVKMF
jgi:hypothetical protein